MDMFQMWIVFLFIVSITNAEWSLPRGVPESRRQFYKPAKEFQCLDGKHRIPYDQVNDDYCDCLDGSDEPGTSACSNGLFYCKNDLHTPQMLRSSRVNDHICDCCDGSDEYDGEISCPNTCEELGRSAREEKERSMAMRSAGWEKRKELSIEGLRMKKEKEEGITDLRMKKELLEPEKRDLEEVKNSIEEKEKEVRKVHEEHMNKLRIEKKRSAATLLFNTIDTNKDGIITLDELKALSYVDSNSDGTVEVIEVKRFVGEKDESDLDHFITNSFHPLRQMRRDKIADEKRAIEENEVKEDEQLNDKDEHIEKHADDDEEIEEDGSEVNDPIDEFDDNVPFTPFSDEDNKIFEAAREARQKYDEVKKKMDEIDGQINDAESFSNHDFGADFAWAPLKGKCIELSVGEYIYKLCPFDKCTQKEKNGYSETNMGTWKEWTNRYSTMYYGDGTTCWNGPARSTTVSIQCGDVDELVDASEPGRCEYHFTFRTPAACEDPSKDEPIHQEL